MVRKIGLEPICPFGRHPLKMERLPDFATCAYLVGRDGFEPPSPAGNGFTARRNRPLCHLPIYGSRTWNRTKLTRV